MTGQELPHTEVKYAMLIKVQELCTLQEGRPERYTSAIPARSIDLAGVKVIMAQSWDLCNCTVLCPSAKRLPVVRGSSPPGLEQALVDIHGGCQGSLAHLG